MKKIILSICILAALLSGLWTAKLVAERAAEGALARHRDQAPAVQMLPETTAAPETWEPETTEPVPMVVPATLPAETEGTIPAETTQPILLHFTEEEEALLLQLGAAERGETYCTECIALVMRTVLNRVESPKFSSTIKGVIYAQDQFTPVMDGSFEKAQPNPACQDALDMIKAGWDESQGALYYEWCEGESWHSQNLNLLLQHCDTRFYN